jgi:hypothetical protein
MNPAATPSPPERVRQMLDGHLSPATPPPAGAERRLGARSVTMPLASERLTPRRDRRLGGRAKCRCMSGDMAVTGLLPTLALRGRAA